MKLLKHWHWHYITTFLMLQVNGSPKVSYCTRSQTKDWKHWINLSRSNLQEILGARATPQEEHSPCTSPPWNFSEGFCVQSLSIRFLHYSVLHIFIPIPLYMENLPYHLLIPLNHYRDSCLSKTSVFFWCWHSFGLRNRKFSKRD